QFSRGREHHLLEFHVEWRVSCSFADGGLSIQLGERMLNSTKWLTAACIALTLAAFAPQGAWAEGDPMPMPWDDKDKGKGKKKSKKLKESSLNQDQVYSLGYTQAKAGDYNAALATLRSASNQDDPRDRKSV